jgi:hypothetical protein
MRYLIAATGALVMAVSIPATATVPHKSAHPHASAAAKADKMKMAIPDMGAVFDLFDKLFPPQPDPDPARFAMAQGAVGAMWPDGSYGKMMTGMLDGMVDRAMTMKASDLEALSGKASAKDADADDDSPSLHDLAASSDPHFDERVAEIRTAVDEEIGKVSTVIDPRIREGLARTMARRFDQAQLADINAFFATPTGRAFAGQYMQMWMSPDTMRSIFKSVPELMTLMPEMMAKVKAVSDKFPKPAKAAAKEKE